jgi:hypothetical protein
MSMAHRYKGSDEIKLDYQEKNLSQCYFPHHKSHTERLDIDIGLVGERLAIKRRSRDISLTDIDTFVVKASEVIRQYKSFSSKVFLQTQTADHFVSKHSAS